MNLETPKHPDPFELAVERDDLHKAAWLAIVVQECADVPDWLQAMAKEVANAMGFWLTWGGGAGPRPLVRMVPVLMRDPWGYAYQEMTDEFMLDLPEEVKAACPADALLARRAAEACDTQGFSMDCRLECLEVLNKTLARLKNYADDAGLGCLRTMTAKTTRTQSRPVRK
ncbi:MAG TPA: hypothetical protein VME67_05580 [Mycobacterium sp.]|nr:hypothetical protein [Mycobacterium sp.]HTX94342.1 hypothetical protein [Mycobacterium sp.]